MTAHSRTRSRGTRTRAPGPSGVRVLVVGRAQDWGRRVQALLPHGSDSVVADCAARAIALLLSGSWDVILCDLELPDARPLELFRAIRALRPETSTRIVWLCDQAGLAHEAFLASVSNWILYAPYDAPAVEDVLTRVRSQRRQDETP